MFLVDDIWDETQIIAGFCDEAKLFRWIADAVNLTANKADFEGWKGTIDICTTGDGRCVSLPREVGVVYAVNIGGRPTLGLGQLFNFHLNGPGDCTQACEWSWQDLGVHATYQDLVTPAKLVAYTASEDDNGKQLIVYGYDKNGNRLQRIESDGRKDGYLVPTIYGYAIPDDEAPEVGRIIRVYKADTLYPVRLSTIDNDGNNGQLLSVMEPDERFPQYRRIKLGRKCDWVRISYRRANTTFTSKADHILLHSRRGFLLAMQAIKAYDDKDLAAAHAFEADAARIELEAQNAIESPTVSPIQVLNANGLKDKSDVDIV